MAKLKGHAVIELTDVKTGKKEHYEHNNLITNGAQKLLDYFTAWFGGTTLNSVILPIEQKLMCGIYLFDGTLTENVNNILLPDVASTKITGYAGNATSDGNDNKRGDFNISESGAITNGYKFVWDFGTDDANGDIACVALTNFIGGYHGYNINFRRIFNSQTNTGNSRANYKGYGGNAPQMSGLSNAWELANIVSYDGEIATTINKTSSSTIEIKRYRITQSKIKIGSIVSSATLLDTQTINYSDSNQNSTQTKFVDGGDGYYYGLYAASSYGTYNLSISKIDKTTLTYTAATVYALSFSGTNTYMPMIANITFGTQGATTDVIIKNGYIYAYYGKTSYSGSGTYGIIKIPLSNPTEWSKLTNTEKAFTLGSSETVFYFLKINGNVYTSLGVLGSDDSIVQYASDFSIEELNSYYGFTNICTNGETIIVQYHSNSSNIVSPCGMFMNIESVNNLDTPVTKTAAKTMKITYTLTYAE